MEKKINKGLSFQNGKPENLDFPDKELGENIHEKE